MADERGALAIEVCWVQAHGARRFAFSLPAGSCVADALAHPALAEVPRAPASESPAWPAGLAVAMAGRVVSGQQRLQTGDRIDLLAPLVVDPKVARRRRAEHQRQHRTRRRA